MYVPVLSIRTPKLDRDVHVPFFPIPDLGDGSAFILPSPVGGKGGSRVGGTWTAPRGPRSARGKSGAGGAAPAP